MLSKTSKKEYLIEEIEKIVYSLDWSKILMDAINSRPTSWAMSSNIKGAYPVNEWRNASDELMFSFLKSFREKIGVEHPLKRALTEIQKFHPSPDCPCKRCDNKDW